MVAKKNKSPTSPLKNMGCISSITLGEFELASVLKPYVINNTLFEEGAVRESRKRWEQMGYTSSPARQQVHGSLSNKSLRQGRDRVVPLGPR